MKQRLLVMLIGFMTCLSMSAQNLMEFHLNIHGVFDSNDGFPFAQMDFPDKTAEELYDMVKSNVLSYYNDPKVIISDATNSYLLIRAIKPNFMTLKARSGKQPVGVQYDLKFTFKDGCIVCKGPEVKPEFISSDQRWHHGFFPLYVIALFNKKGEVKNKDCEAKKRYIESSFNSTVNCLLGLLKTDSIEVYKGEW